MGRRTETREVTVLVCDRCGTEHSGMWFVEDDPDFALCSACHFALQPPPVPPSRKARKKPRISRPPG